jgi:hypothetical protein
MTHLRHGLSYFVAKYSTLLFNDVVRCARRVRGSIL